MIYFLAFVTKKEFLLIQLSSAQSVYESKGGKYANKTNMKKFLVFLQFLN